MIIHKSLGHVKKHEYIDNMNLLQYPAQFCSKQNHKHIFGDVVNYKDYHIVYIKKTSDVRVYLTPTATTISAHYKDTNLLPPD